MADKRQLKMLKQGVAAWNEWRREDIKVDLSRADLYLADLCLANLNGADLSGANLFDANLSNVNLRRADSSSAISTEPHSRKRFFPIST
jgi:uncharacterized protein YjbI with pentapeptide repeats